MTRNMNSSGLLKKQTRIFAIMLISILLTLSCFSIFVYSADFTYGDVSGNGRVEASDVTVLRRYLLEIIVTFPYENGKIAADVNGDNLINAGDLLLIRRYVLGIITVFPASTQQPTVTPTTVTPTPPIKGNVTYTLVKVANPTSDQQDAYNKIQSAMDTAVSYYNKYTSITKQLRIVYEPSVSTADGNINGNIRFGSNRTYMNHITAMHEIAHTVGVGTSSKWRTLVVNKVYTGTYATEQIRAITGNNSSVINGDTTHFWPYGLNYTSEVKSEADLINHCKIVDAMKKDGL